MGEPAREGALFFSIFMAAGLSPFSNPAFANHGAEQKRKTRLLQKNPSQFLLVNTFH